MTRKRTILLRTGIAVALLFLIVAVAAIQVTRTDWFRNYVAAKIIAATEQATGGKVEIGSFRFDWRHLHAEVTDFVLHGTEPAGVAPLIRAPRVQVNIRLFTSIHHLLDVAYLGIDRPEANIVILADGHNNLPSPKPASSNGPPLQSIVNAAIGHFDLSNAIITVADEKETLSLHANNFRAELWYSALASRYRGKLSFQPLYVASGRNTPVTLTVTLPVSLESDRVSLEDATIATLRSTLHIDGSVEDLRNPKLAAHVAGQIALADLKGLGNLPLDLEAPGVPAVITVDTDGNVSRDAVHVSRLRLTAGQSSIEASGALKDSSGNGDLRFKAQAALGEMGRLMGLATKPEGMVTLSGSTSLDAANNYKLDGALTASRISVQHGAGRVGNFDLTAALHVDPHTVALSGLRMNAFGGVLEGRGSLQELAHYQFRGNLQNLTLQSALVIAGQEGLPYAGTIGGPISVAGDLNDSRTLSAQVELSIAPGKTGIPISGRLSANYNAAADDLRVENSYLVLPRSRLNLDGSASRQLNVSLTTTDLGDLLPAMSPGRASPVDLKGHPAQFTGTVVGGLMSGRLAGHLRANSFSVEGRDFASLALDAEASSGGIVVENASLTRGAMQAEFSGQVGMYQWKITPRNAFNLQLDLRNTDLADLLALAGRPDAATSGALSATAQFSGTVGDPLGSATLTAVDGILYGEPFDRIQARMNLSDQLIDLSSASVQRGGSSLTIASQLHHAPDSFTTGQLHVRVESNQVQLAQVRTLQRLRPNTDGALEIHADVSATIGPSEFALVGGTGTATARGLRFDNENYGDVTIDARSSGQTVQYEMASTFAGSNIRVTGDTRLQPDYPTSLDATVARLPIERVLDAARRKDIPAKGTLSGTVHFSGTKQDPAGNVDLSLTNAVLYDEPVDTLRAKATYDARRVQIEQLEIAGSGAQVGLTAQFDHPQDNLNTGNLQFHVNSSSVNLARVHNLQGRFPGLGGTLHMDVDGAAELRALEPNTSEPRVSFKNLKASVAVNGVTRQNKNLGDATLTADTGSDNKIALVLTSNLAGATIQGRGTAQTSGDYPMDAQINFSNVAWTQLQDLIGQEVAGQSRFNAGVDGQIVVQGPAAKPEQLRGSLRLSRLEVGAAEGAAPKSSQLTLKNQEPIAATLEAGTVRIESAHLAGAQSDLQAKGSFSFKDQAVNLTLNGNANLGVLQTLNRYFSSSGNVILAATVRGTVSKPAINGTLQLQKASFTDTRLPNGISNATGSVVFSGNSASVRNLTAESGGGKLTLTGFLLMTENPQFGLRVNASGVRLDVQQDVSVVTNANLNLTGTGNSSTISGRATVTRINYAPRTDLGSILTRAAPSVRAPSTASPLLDNMRLDIQVGTSDALAVRSSLAQSLEGNANLQVRGTASEPSVLGRVTMTGGKVTFFGTSYTVESGTISFYDPVRIQPVLDVNLSTNTEGVDVTLRVNGPIDNLKLSYTSDPPLQFEEIVGLLAAGTTPTSDPTLLANNPPAQQSVSEMGESALLGNAVANPVANRLQRVFGITQLKINPAFTNGSAQPDATLSLQQQIAKNITFTYVTDVQNANAETIRVEVTLNSEWSAAAMRDENGIFSINLLYKRQFR